MAERYPCIDCMKHVRRNQQAVQCENCEGWQHRSCDTGISISDYRLAVSGEMEISFVCKPCAERIPHIDDNIADDDSDVMLPIDDDSDVMVPVDDDGDVMLPVDDDSDVMLPVITPALIEDSDSFRIEVPFEEPVVIHERSLDDSPLPDEVTPDAPLTYEVITNGSQKGSDLLVDSAGYSYNIKDRRGKCVRWSCSVKNKTMRCMATVSQKEGHYKQGTAEHTHPPDASRGANAKVAKQPPVVLIAFGLTELECLDTDTQAKEIARKDVFTSARSIVSQAREEVDIVPGVGTVKEDYLARRTNRKRVAMRPADPKDMDFVLDDGALPEGFLRDDIEVEGRRHIIFAHDAQVGVLRRAARWYVDGTFKCMRLPFMMLLTIHAFVTRADCSKQVPLVFALMTGRRTRDYIAVFESIKAFLGVDAAEGMVMDYEKAMWKAARTVFPDISLSGCAFHWGQAVWRHVQSLGLATQYTSDQATHAYIRKLLSLPFLPKEHIRPTFQSMVEFNTSEPITPLLEYLNRHWFSSSVWSVDEWCVYGQAVRTNNDVEGWHRRLNAKTGVAPPFYILVGVLHREARAVQEQVHLVSELSLRRIQRKAYRTMQAKLFHAWDLYAAGEISTTGLLKKVSGIYGHSVTVLPVE